MIQVMLAAVLLAVGFCCGIEYTKYAERKACDARVQQAKANAENFYKVEAHAFEMRCRNNEAKLIEQFNAAIQANAELYQRRELLLQRGWMKSR